MFLIHTAASNTEVTVYLLALILSTESMIFSNMLVGFTAVGAARGPVELEDLDWMSMMFLKYQN